MAASKIKADSETNESDESREMFCESCENEGKYAVAQKYCVDCNTFMCSVCLKYHNMYQSEHVIKDKDHMPQDYCFEKCSSHPNKCLKYYCLECNKFACSKCASDNGSTSHELACTSQTWSPIHTVVQNTADNSYGHTEVAYTTCDIKRMEHNIISARQKCHKSNDQVRESIKLHRKDIERRIIELESQFLRSIDDREHTFSANLDSVLSEVTVMKVQMESLESHQNKVRQTGNRCSKFIAMKESRSSVVSVRDRLANVEDKLFYKDYAFDTTECPILNERNFGSFVPRQSKQKLKAVHTHDMDVAEYYAWFVSESVNDVCKCDGLIVALVRGSFKIVLLNLTQRKFLSNIITSSSPARLTDMSRRRTAVTLPGEGIIQIFGILDQEVLEKRSDIKVELGCWGIAYSKNQDCLYVSYLGSNSKITTIKETGEVLRVLEKDILGNNLFINPRNIALKFDERSLYVSDTGRNMVIKTSLDGKVETVYKDKDLKCPRGIAIDENGSVFVCGEESNNIHQLSPDLSKIGIAIESNDIQTPLSVAVYNKGVSKCLFVGMSHNTKIKVFSLTTN